MSHGRGRVRELHVEVLADAVSLVPQQPLGLLVTASRTALRLPVLTLGPALLTLRLPLLTLGPALLTLRLPLLALGPAVLALTVLRLTLLRLTLGRALTRPLSPLPLLRRLPGLPLQLLSLVLELVLHAHVDSLPLWVRGSGLDQTNTHGHPTHFDQ
ncbi:hypothetical protein [Streptomyces sp. MB09-02B]|uniref:hypothetical protein n=1 Tax=Streptomyces sp. MB09-02B TaxID=3028667 RepID=UPI0029B8B461|nr:hypothetical protein [Streptomyces sp. MB09-02B]MDX3638857.1 hypothetical protein [Streptomyces sp. MB09-02B]